MCGRYTSTAAFDELALRFGITIESGTDEELTARYNVAPTQMVPIIRANDKGRRLIMAKWGFRPAWVKSATLAPIVPDFVRQGVSDEKSLSINAACHNASNASALHFGHGRATSTGTGRVKCFA